MVSEGAWICAGGVPGDPGSEIGLVVASKVRYIAMQQMPD